MIKLITFFRKILDFIEFRFLKNNRILFPQTEKEEINFLKKGDSLLFDNFYMNVALPIKGKNYLTVGNDSMIGGNYIFESPNGEVIIGDRVYISGGHFISSNKIIIENDVFISWGVYLFDNDSHSIDYRNRQEDMLNHLNDWRLGLKNYNTSKNWSVVNSAPIKIEKHVWIGMEVTILKGVTIGEGAIIGAKSVVTKNVEPWTIVGGNPAKKLRDIPLELQLRI